VVAIEKPVAHRKTQLDREAFCVSRLGAGRAARYLKRFDLPLMIVEKVAERRTLKLTGPMKASMFTTQAEEPMLRRVDCLSDVADFFIASEANPINRERHATALCGASGRYVAIKRRTLASVSGHMRRPASMFLTNDLSFMASSPNCQMEIA
jgi:hypothetical protein